MSRAMDRFRSGDEVGKELAELIATDHSLLYIAACALLDHNDRFEIDGRVIRPLFGIDGEAPEPDAVDRLAIEYLCEWWNCTLLDEVQP